MPNIRVLTVIGLVLISTSIFAQNNNQSPLSRYGFGDLQNLGAAAQRIAGGTGLALTNPRQINLLNPNSGLDLSSPIFNVNLVSNFSNITGKNFDYKQSHTSLHSFAMAFPVKNKFAFQFGLRPYSAINYDLNSTTVVGQDTVATNYSGSGGLKNAFVAVSYDLFHDKDSVQLAVGLQVDHLFGPLEQSRTLYTDALQNGYGIRENRQSNLGGTAPNFFVSYRTHLGKQSPWELTAAVQYQPQFKLKGDQETFAFTFLRNFGGLESGKDTISYSATSDNSAVVPQRMGLGLSLSYRDKLQVGVDYRQQSWSDFSQSLSNTNLNGNFVDYQRFSAGVQYTPELNILFNEPIWKYVTYSAGFWQSSGYISLGGEELSEFGTSFGMRIPFRRSKSNSALILGVEYMERGNVETQLLKERNTRILVGLSLTPNFIDRWFYKRKYD